MVAQNMLCTHKGKYIFSDKDNRFVTALDLIKCLKQIKYQILFLTCASISELPSIITMGLRLTGSDS